MNDTPNFLTCPAVPELPSPPPLPPVPEHLEPYQPRRRVGWIVLGVIIIVLAICAPLIYGLGRAGFAALQMRQSAKQAEAHAKSGNFASLGGDVDSMEQSVNDIIDALHATGGWRSFPVVGKQIQALEEVARAGQIAIGGAHDLVTAARSLQDALSQEGATRGALETGVAPSQSFRDLTAEQKRAILARFDESLPDLRAASEKMHLAREAWDRVPEQTLFAPVRMALAPIATLLPEFESKLNHAVSLAEIILPLSGYPKPKAYLAILQNADEIRPTGGFIGNVGVIRIDAGDLQKVKFEDVYTLDRPSAGKIHDVPPEPLRRELYLDAWYFRDSNWSPDFPTTALRLMDIYNRERQAAGSPTTNFSGVIALQPGFFEDLLRLTGPITVDGKTFNADNFFTELEYDVEIGFLQTGTPIAQRKETIAKVGDALINKLMSLPSSQWSKLLDLVFASLDHKDILIYDRDPKFLALLDAKGWTGRVKAAPEDALWVVDANLAALKTDGVMDKQVRYALDMTDPAGPVATVTLHYRNTNKTITWRYSRYRDYVRVYVPEGSQLLSSTGAMANDISQTHGVVVSGTVDVMHDLGRTVYGAFWAIEPGETRDLTFRYRLPPSVSTKTDGLYQLLVQKQPGSNTELTLDLLFGKKLASAVPPEESSQFGDARYRATFELDRDRTIDIKLNP